MTRPDAPTEPQALPGADPYHVPVLGDAVRTLLDGCPHVVDGTLGGGGHAQLLLETGHRVTGVDRDPEARAAAARRLAPWIADGRCRLLTATFAEAPALLPPGEAVHAVLLDLGVSSRQLDDERRGFSFRVGAPLDARMDPSAGGATVAALLNAASADDLAAWFRDYGDEPRARRLAAEVVRRRATRPFAVSDDLVGAIRGALGPRTGPSDFARLFQALRLVVNDEPGELARALPAWRDRLAPGGVLAVISYHSGEDRVVKAAFRDWSASCTCPPRQPTCTCGGVAAGARVTRKAIVADAVESAANPRARSARLRAWRKSA